jgi:hypothetical protein
MPVRQLVLRSVTDDAQSGEESAWALVHVRV